MRESKKLDEWTEYDLKDEVEIYQYPLQRVPRLIEAYEFYKNLWISSFYASIFLQKKRKMHRIIETDLQNIVAEKSYAFTNMNH